MYGIGNPFETTGSETPSLVLYTNGILPSTGLPAELTVLGTPPTVLPILSGLPGVSFGASPRTPVGSGGTTTLMITDDKLGSLGKLWLTDDDATFWLLQDAKLTADAVEMDLKGPSAPTQQTYYLGNEAFFLEGVLTSNTQTWHVEVTRGYYGSFPQVRTLAPRDYSPGESGSGDAILVTKKPNWDNGFYCGLYFFILDQNGAYVDHILRRGVVIGEPTPKERPYYDIQINKIHYTPNWIDNKSKIAWEKGDNGLNFKKKLEGTFVFNRSNNEALYDMISIIDHCSVGYISILDENDVLIATSVFNKRDIIYNQDRCNISIKPRYYERSNIDAISEKDYNIINDQIPMYSVTYATGFQFEFRECFATDVFLGLTIGDDCYPEVLTNDFPITKALCTGLHSTFSFYAQENTITSNLDPFCDTPLWDIKTTYFRETKLILRAVDPDPVNSPNPPPQGDSIYPFEFVEEVSINGINSNKYARNVDLSIGVNVYTSGFVRWYRSSYYGYNETRTITRARKLMDILEHFSTELGCTAISSQFFNNNVNPKSFADLTNILIAQKSDCIFDAGIEPSDPATLGIITFKQLMDFLWAMFQVTWVIQDEILYIEHINYFRFNFSYAPNATVGIDLTVYYPSVLKGSRIYSYDENLPIREKFKFMEAWNIDFRGTDIEYTNCLREGSTDTYSADLITTDLDPTYLDNEASKDGFCLFHCIEVETIIAGVYNYEVISEVGRLSGISSPNAHLSWANLHSNYWNSNRPLPTGILNNVEIAFSAPNRKLKLQNAIEFPFCVENVDEIVNDLIRTTMGDGEITSAEYDLKTGNLKVELSYE